MTGRCFGNAVNIPRRETTGLRMRDHSLSSHPAIRSVPESGLIREVRGPDAKENIMKRSAPWKAVAFGAALAALGVAGAATATAQGSELAREGGATASADSTEPAKAGFGRGCSDFSRRNLIGNTTHRYGKRRR